MLCRDPETSYGGRQADAIMFLTRLVAAAIVALTPGAAAAPLDPPRAPVIICTNPASGATWRISIDYARATVDSNPAQVSATEISWHDAKDGGSYTLDRRSGALTVVLASSTGGYFLHDRCRLPP